MYDGYELAGDGLMTAPMVPPEVDLRDFPFVPLYRRRLFSSRFYRLASTEEFKAAFLLWIKSWDEIPAGSLPNNDRELYLLAELRGNLEWRKVKRWALHGWELCDDGRLYHPVVAEITLAAWERKIANRHRTAAATEARRRKRDDQRNVVQGTGTGTGIKKEANAASSGNGLDKVDNLEKPGPKGGRSAPLKETRKALLVQKLMRFANATLKPEESRAAVRGLMSLDEQHDMQWWLDKLDKQMRAQRWDDARGQ